MDGMGEVAPVLSGTIARNNKRGITNIMIRMTTSEECKAIPAGPTTVLLVGRNMMQRKVVNLKTETTRKL